MPKPFTSQDLSRIFDAGALTRARSLGLLGRVDVRLEDDTIVGTVRDRDIQYTIRITPDLLGRRVVFDNQCS